MVSFGENWQPCGDLWPVSVYQYWICLECNCLSRLADPMVSILMFPITDGSRSMSRWHVNRVIGDPAPEVGIQCLRILEVWYLRVRQRVIDILYHVIYKHHCVLEVEEMCEYNKIRCQRSSQDGTIPSSPTANTSQQQQYWLLKSRQAQKVR